VIEGDSRTVRLDDHLGAEERLSSKRIDGVFTSPPYVGQIDYHEQHRYAYELFEIERRDGLEIGPKAKGKGERAKSDYSRSMAESLSNVRALMTPGAPVLLVANDRLGLYPGIFEEAGMRVERSFERPVEDRTERDKRPYSETVFLARLVR
jgi:DNA modification methylase